jgi:CrcB protein
VSLLFWIGVAALGSLGAIARFLLDGWVSSRTSARFPLGTFAVNTSGAALLGFLSGVALTGNALVLAGSALLGSYTTFSTWMLETHRLGEEGQVRAATANVTVSIVVGVGAAALGRVVGGWL